MLGNVLMLCTFVFFIFGVVAVQLWAGVLRQRCYLNFNDSTTSQLPNRHVPFNLHVLDSCSRSFKSQKTSRTGLNETRKWVQ